MKQSPIPLNVKLSAIDIETTGLERDDEIVSASIAYQDEDGSIQSNFYWLDRFSDRCPEDEQAFVDDLGEILWSPGHDRTAVFHNISFDLPRIVRRFKPSERFSSVNFCRLVDTAAISRTLRNNKFTSHIDPHKLKAHSLKYLAKEILGVDHKTFEDVVGGGNIRFADREQLAAYNRADAEIALKLYLAYKKNSPALVWSYYEGIEYDQTINLLHLDFNGVPFDLDKAYTVLDAISSLQGRLSKEIFLSVGKSFNLASGDELSRAIFFNRNFTYGDSEVVKPLYKTDKGRIKTDLDTLVELKSRLSANQSAHGVVTTLNKIMQYEEIAKIASSIEDKTRYAIGTLSGPRIYPNFNANAKSGRATTSRPNLLGLPKRIFKKSEITEDIPRIPVDLRDESVRKLIRASQGESILSIDVSALDISVLGDRARRINPETELAKYFGREGLPIDIHMAMFSRMDPPLYEKCLSSIISHLQKPLSNYFVHKMADESVSFLDKTTGEEVKIQFPSKEHFDESSKQRDVFKTVNLSSGYLIGGAELAVKIRKGTGRRISAKEAQVLLDKFYEAYPEIRQDQDMVAQAVYARGYVQSVFGKNFYADVFDDLNAHQRQAQENQQADQYDFVLLINGRYYYLRAQGWRKQTEPVTENLKTTETPFGLAFDRIEVICELPQYPFRKKLSALRAKFERKNENSVEENSAYEESRIEITARVDEHISLGTTLTSDAEAILNSFIRDGAFFIPEKDILFYRVNLKDPSSKYFRYYSRFIKVVRKFYPLLCQGIAAAVAAKCLTEIRKFIETHPELGVKLILFVHDQIVVTVPNKHVELMKKVLMEAVESDKSPFRIRLSGKIECGETYR